MNTEQRRALRHTLREQGFFRTGFTDDFGGVHDYHETWTRGDTEVTIAWGPLTV